MIQIEDKAHDYLSRLLAGQDDDDVALRIRVEQPGTPAAEVEFEFSFAEDRAPADHIFDVRGLKVVIDEDSIAVLEDAEVGFSETPTGGEILFRAPKLRGESPSDDAPLAERVAFFLDAQINPMLAQHGGRVALREIDSEQRAVLEFGGGCHGCGMVSVTLRDGIERQLLGSFPSLKGIVDATDHAKGENPYTTQRPVS